MKRICGNCNKSLPPTARTRCPYCNASFKGTRISLLPALVGLGFIVTLFALLLWYIGTLLGEVGTLSTSQLL